MSGDLVTIITIVTTVAALAGALGGHLLQRRASSGRVSTSEAAILWAEAQDVRRMQEERIARTEAQRDRLMEAYTEQVLPVLSSLHDLVSDLSGAVADGVATVHRLAAALGEEAGREAQPPQGPRR